MKAAADPQNYYSKGKHSVSVDDGWSNRIFLAALLYLGMAAAHDQKFKIV